MNRYTKDDVEFHSERYCGRGYPAVNVKVHSLYHLTSKIEDHFKCDESTAEKALQFAFDSHCEMFWNENAQDIATDILGNVKVYSAGRSGGWLIVQGLPDFDEWDAIQLGKWRSFENHIKDEVKYLTSWDYIRDAIDANEWYKSGSEQYNFYQFPDGYSVTIPDMRKEIEETLDPNTLQFVKSCGW